VEIVNYLFTYYGGMVPETPEDKEKVMKVWDNWKEGIYEIYD
jgi:hypothetical protein